MDLKLPEGYVEELISKDISSYIEEISTQIISREKDFSKIVFVGIRSRGQYIAERVKIQIEKKLNISIPIGAIDITFYRDDLAHRRHLPQVQKSELPFNDLTGKIIIIVDDVIFTGRTIRAAMDLIFDYGRPDAIRLAVLVDRGFRELPIQPDYTGLKVDTKREDAVHVFVTEADGEDKIILWRKK